MHPTVGYALSVTASIVWLVAVTNAFNFLDNMDGVCTGIAAVTSLTLVGLAFLSGHLAAAILAAALAGSSLGFLRFNFPPARIFLVKRKSDMSGRPQGPYTVKKRRPVVGTPKRWL